MAVGRHTVATDLHATLRALWGVLSMSWPEIVAQTVLPTVILGTGMLYGLSHPSPAVAAVSATVCGGGITIINGVTVDQLYRAVKTKKQRDATIVEQRETIDEMQQSERKRQQRE